jgi:hypothetical protein
MARMLVPSQSRLTACAFFSVFSSFAINFLLTYEKSMTYFKYMSIENITKNGHGGARKGSGRGAGDKTKICVSVDDENWQSALDIWKQRPSWLVDNLISDYVESNDKRRMKEAV